MDEYYHYCQESLTHQLTKVEFITPLTKSSPDYVVFNFSFKFQSFERLLSSENVRQFTKSLPDYVVGASRAQFFRFQELREAMAQGFGLLGINSGNSRNLVKFAWEQALEIMQSYDLGEQVLELRFDVVVQQRYLIFDETNGSDLPTVDSSIEAFEKLSIDHHNMEIVEELDI